MVQAIYRVGRSQRGHLAAADIAHYIIVVTVRAVEGRYGVGERGVRVHILRIDTVRRTKGGRRRRVGTIALRGKRGRRGRIRKKAVTMVVGCIHLF